MFLLCFRLLVVGAFSLSVRPVSKAYPVAQELYFQQKLDHFNSNDPTLWRHRFLLNSEQWDGHGKLPNGCPGPILLYTGNEAPVDAFWGITGFVVETLASKLGGLVVFSEQRFYGASLPFGNVSHTAQQLRYLTTAQIVADHAAIAEHIKATFPNAQQCPVVAFGGSYGGTLTALLRATYPSTIVGGLAASSELGYYDEAGWSSHGVSQNTFEDVVLATWGGARAGCLDVVQKTLTAIDSADQQLVIDTFNVCDVKALGPGLPSGFFVYVVEGMPQGDYASAGNPVTAACDLLLAATTPTELLSAAGQISKKFFGSDSCIVYDVGGPGNTPGDGPSESPWGYQSCTETLHTFSAYKIRSYNFDVLKSSQLCNSLYDTSVIPNLQALKTAFGSFYAMAEGTPPKSGGSPVTKLIWSQGTLDPWHGWWNKMAAPPAGLDVYHFLIDGGAHHEDLRSDFAGDKASVIAARTQEEAIIRRWITEASQ